MIKFTPSIYDEVRNFLTEKNILASLSIAFNNSLYVLFPRILNQNIQAFQELLKKYQLRGSMFYDYETNESIVLVFKTKSNHVKSYYSSTRLIPLETLITKNHLKKMKQTFDHAQ